MRTPPSLLITRAEPGDLDAVAAIERLAFSDPWSRQAFAGLLTNPAVCFLVAREPTDPLRLPVGYVVMWLAADESEIANLAVAPAVRGRGVGARLLDAALGEAIARGAAMTYLEVRESNAAARQLYASRGFGMLGRRRNYYQHPREDALVLGRPTAPRAAPLSPTGVESAHDA